ncbi:MAG: LbtU family siderophore porin [Gammaproteobacteria bacterium]|nr:LbtU family siderophore porin [Gammaproteobacteria bacterium]
MYFRSGKISAISIWSFYTSVFAAVLIPNHSLAASTEISGVLEAEVGIAEDFEGNSSNDIVQATVEIALNSELSEWFGAHVSLLYEQDATDLEVDNGYIEFGNPFISSFFFRLGQLYVPFGAFESNMISDPLTLEIAETRESAFTIGYEKSFRAALYLFNGDLVEAGGDDTIDNVGIEVGYSFEGESISFDIGFGYINNIAESDGLSGIISDNDPVPDDGVTEVTEYVPGMMAHFIFEWGSFQFIGELAAATKEFAAGEIYAAQKSKPSAANLELAYSFTDNWNLAAGVQNSVDMAGFLPETRFLVATSYRIDEATVLAFEYANDSDYATTKLGTGNSGSSITMQLAAEF